jgi:geranylgeranyl reductase family protein
MITIQPIHKYDCDVLIVGGGPAGSALAYYLAKQSIKVIVIESEKFPRDKICGDAVSAVALAELHKMGITNLEEFAKANEINDVALFIEQEKITVDLARAEDLPFQGRVIPRLQLDNWVYTAAKYAGASFLEEARLSDYSINEWCVSAQIKQGRQTKNIKSKLIVGADGSNSTVARILNGNKPSEAYQLLGLRAYYEDVNGPSDRCDIFFTKDNFPGLFWFFPTGPNTANVGSAMIGSTLPQNQNHVKTLLNNQIKNNKNFADRIGNGKIKGKIQGWPLTFQDPKTKLISNRLLLVGDAAGLINPLSGDGIQYALLSARWASECLVECVNKNDYSIAALSTYKKKLDKEMAYDMALSQLLIQVTRNRTFTPLWMEVLKILFERAKDDKQYAAVIGGIFDGTLPSYKALNPTFILKSLLQGTIHFGLNTASGILQGPQYWAQTGKTTSALATNIIQSIRRQPKDHARWLAGVARKGLQVGGHVIREIRK